MRNDALHRAFDEVPRSDFLPEEVRSHAGVDAPLPLVDGQTNSQPSTVATMLGLLGPQPGHRVLDVGSGSGWTTALLTHLVAPDGFVLGVEIVAELVSSGRAALAPYADGRAEIRRARRDVLGAPEDGPYDRILVSAEADRVPEQLVEQLAEGGVLVVPVAGTMHRIRRTPDGLQNTVHGQYRFVPLL
ncbi:protein-L-isoaspartate carboxylmethyltransferase [Brachybacterium endophyticum]|uniref:Protein-L-isoaspartate O-methyltransferase n=1 Tax=Brachybacterium endophyticum TaxID=2182385 RepID=A0A2U2RMX2_9MICO|nr:protein-L-isoaspartate carboxylmethyltransferase [Brachybacterium endophyticum]PWH07196.1 protein-L-isoaspartate carboxylmethyltransferase [Brachybacterium endophyticum]